MPPEYYGGDCPQAMMARGSGFGPREIRIPELEAASYESPTGFWLLGGQSGPNGSPRIDWGGPGINEIGTAGPYVSVSVNGGGGGLVFLGNGASYVRHTDFYLPLNGIDWFHERTYSSQNTLSPAWQGQKWWSNEMMYIYVAGSDGGSNVTVYMDPHHALTFTYSGGSWTCGDHYLYALTFSSGSHEYLLKRPDGFTYVFHDKNVSGVAKKLKRIEDPYGNDWAFNYDTDGEGYWWLSYIDVDVVQGSDHRITYSYFDAGTGNLQYIKVYKTTTTTDANLIGKVEYVYHGTGTDDYGLLGDLMKVIVSHKGTSDGDGTLSIQELYYYRYYKGTWNTESNPGTDHQLRFVLLPENADRLNTAKGDPLTQSNADFDDYANVIYEYESGNTLVRKTEERLPGTSCCSGGGGSAAVTNYDWEVNGSTPDLDTWKVHGRADRQDNSRVFFDMNRLYQVLTWVVQDENDGSPNYELIWHFDYGTSGAAESRLATIHYPSACSAYDESTAPYTVTVRSDAGLIYEMDYDYATNTYDGYPERVRVKQGSSGTAQTLKAYGRSESTRPDLATTITEYESTGEADGRSTTLAYTFYDSGGAKVQVKEIDTTHPSVSTDKNGPGASAVEKKFFDKRSGALRWTLDGEGYVNFYAYDDETGVEDLSVVDANTSTLMQVIDDNWNGVTDGDLAGDDSVPFSRTGGGTALDIDSSSVIDWLGRTRKTTDAGGMITYYVYKDDETRVYPAWNTSTLKPLLPMEIVKTDKEGRPEEQVSLLNTFTPNTTSNEPNGTAGYANSDLVEWTVNSYSKSGNREYTNRYHSIPDSGSGTRYTNFYRTAHEYDSMGRLEYLIEDVADESSYDREQVTRHYYDFMGRQTKVEEGVSDNTHDITGGKPTLTKTAEYFYDDPDSDSTPEQGAGDGNLRWVRRWYGTGSDYTDTEYRYDWRNRQCLTIPPSSPYTLVKHDHLGRVTATGSYNATTNLDPGDDPATTENGSRLSLSRTYYDEWGRVYKTETYDDPGDATPEDKLVSETYYDRRRLVWATDPANTGISFTKYDGAGRRFQTFSGTQFDTNKYSSNAPDYPDDDEGIVQLTDYTLNDAGNVTKTVTKELNHNDTAGMDLTNNDNYIRTYAYNYYDAAHRLTDTANFGTNSSDGWKDNSTAPTYDNDGGTPGDQPPSRSDTILVTTYTYNSAGRQEKVTDPKAIDTKQVFDSLGRTVAKIEDEGESKLNRKTEYQYNAQGSLVRIMHDPSADNTFADGVWTIAGDDVDQVTEYAYTDSQSAGRVKEIRYPTGDGTVGSTQQDKIVFAYNADGTLSTRTDQNGTVLTWSYDNLRRKTKEVVTTTGTYTGGAGAVDGAVLALTWTYKNDGKVECITSHTDTDPDTSNWTDVSNQIKYTYNAADRLTKEEQEEDGAVDGSTLAVEYGYGTDYSTGNYHRRNYVEYPDGRKVWNYYAPTSNPTFQETINTKFSRVGEIRRDNSGAAGDTLAQYYFNGLGRQVRREHEEASGKYGNDTKMDLWQGTSGWYKGLDRFGRVVDMRFTDIPAQGNATDFLRRKYTHDRDSNRSSIEDSVYKSESQSFTYDQLNRLTDAKRGVLDTSSQVLRSDVYENFNMDLLGNFTSAAGGIKLNTTSSTITQAVNATNEITTLDFANPSGAATIINEPFSTLSSSLWTQLEETWSIDSNKVKATCAEGEGTAMLLTTTDLDIINYEVEVTFPSSQASIKRAGLVFAHNGSSSYYAVILDRGAGEIALYKVTNGSWGSALTYASATISINTAYTLKVARKQSEVEAVIAGQSGTTIWYDSATDFGTGKSGLYASHSNIKFDNFKAYRGVARDAKTPRVGGLADTSLSSGELLVKSNILDHRGGETIVQGFHDDYFVAQADVQKSGYPEIWVRYTDANNAYRIFAKSIISVHVKEIKDGEETSLGSASVSGSPGMPHELRVRVYDDNGTDKIDVYMGGTKQLTVTLTDPLPAGGVAFACKQGYDMTFDNAKVGYDKNGDGDIADDGDDIIWDENFGSTSKTVSYDHAGNLIDDGVFRYVYDAWNRLVKVQSSQDSGAATFQQAEFDGTGRRMKKVVTNSGDLNATIRYYYDGQKIIETRLGGAPDVPYQQLIHGTQYIDELVMIRVKDKGDLYVHQDANWNVIGLTDLGGSLVERYAYTPYGELTVYEETGYGDRDGDGDVDATDKGTVGTTCTGTVSGACRVLDLDFDGDYDSTDAGNFDSLPQGLARHPGRIATNVHQPFAHQGLLYEPEAGQYQNRARQYDPAKRRFAQRDPAWYVDGLNTYGYVKGNPLRSRDPLGRCTNPGGCDKGTCTPTPPPPPPPPTPGTPPPPPPPTPPTSPAGCPLWTPCKAWAEQEKYDNKYTYDWLGLLPNCPCSLSGGNNPDSNTWEDPEGGLYIYYHPGAAKCMRSKKAYGSWCSGQQCCYDSAGGLITAGQGAGTPDKVAPDTNESSPNTHTEQDVNTYKKCLGTKQTHLYREARPPNNGNNCPYNRVDG